MTGSRSVSRGSWSQSPETRMPRPRAFFSSVAAIASVVAIAAVGSVSSVGLIFLVGCGGPRYRALDFEAALARAKADPAYSDSTDRDHSLVSFDVITLGSLVPDPWSVREAVGNVEANASGNPGKRIRLNSMSVDFMGVDDKLY